MGRCELGPNGWICPPITSQLGGFTITKTTEANLPDADSTNIDTCYQITDADNVLVYNFDGVSWTDITPGVTREWQPSLWADRATPATGTIKRFTDICSAYAGANTNVPGIFDGTYWQPLGGAQDIASLRARVAGSAGASSSPADQTIALNAALLNIYGGVEVQAAFDTANVQTVTFLPKCNFGASTTFDGSTSMGTKKLFRFKRTIRNTGAANAQIVMESANADDGLTGTSSNQAQILAIDTSAAVNLVVGGTATHATSITCSLSSLKVIWRR